MKKQTEEEEQCGDRKFLKPSNKKDELKQTERIFQRNLMNDLVRAKLKQTVNLEDIIKTDDLYYK